MILSYIKNISLQKKIVVILVVFILLPLATLGLFFNISSERYVSERVNKETLQTLQLLRENVDQLLINYGTQLMTIYQREEIIQQLRDSSTGKKGSGNEAGSGEAITRFIKDFIRANDEIESMFIFPSGPQKVYFSDYKGPSFFLEQYKLHPEWGEALEASKGEVVWLNTYRTPPNQYHSQSTFAFIGGIEIRDIFGVLEPLGKMFVNVKTEVLTKMIGDVQVSPNGFVMVADSDGHVIWHRNKDILGESMAEIPFFSQAVKAKKNYVTQQLNGKMFRVTYTQSNYNHWYYFSFVPLEDIASETVNMKKYLGVTLLLSLVFYSLLAGLSLFSITKPLRRMAVAMNSFDKDHLLVKVDTDSRDEIGMLQGAFNRMSSRISDLIEEVKIVTAKEKEAELKALQAQINPHFVYNTLDTINWMALEKDESGISKMITALSDIMRYAITNGSSLVSIQEEIRWVENYVYIQKNRFEDRFHVYFDIDSRVLSCKIPRLLLQPFVENAIIHGMEDMEEDGRIMISIRLDESLSRIVFEVEDNGCGMNEETLQAITTRKNTGIGIHNIDDRLKLEYGQEYGVQIDSAEGIGTKFTIVAPHLKDDSLPADPAKKEAGHVQGFDH